MCSPCFLVGNRRLLAKIDVQSIYCLLGNRLLQSNRCLISKMDASNRRSMLHCFISNIEASYLQGVKNPFQPVTWITRPVAPSHNLIHGASYHCVKGNQSSQTLVIQSLNQMTCITISISLCCEQHLVQDHCLEAKVSVRAQSSDTMTS